MSIGFEVERIDDVALAGPDDLLAKNLMSPFAWRVAGDAGLMMLVRAVPPDKGENEESGRIWYGRSGSDGLTFHMNDAPLPVANGAPLRLRVERQLGYKMAKYVMRIELVESFAAIGDGGGGYWEDQGYQWYAGI